LEKISEEIGKAAGNLRAEATDDGKR
jgi:hypothetical protein